jgi:hypothetical protein
MKKLLTGDCTEDNIFQLLDPTAFVEIDFEAEVVKALTCLFSDYWCGVFAGTFLLEASAVHPRRHRSSHPSPQSLSPI